MEKKSFLKRHWSNILILSIIILLFVPQTGMPIKVFFNRLISFSPSVLNESDQEILATYKWKLEDVDGNTINFKTSDGKVTLINFWATWCPPCVAELPALQNLYDEYGTQVDFYFVTDEAPAKVVSFMDKKGYELPVFFLQQSPPDQLRTTALPTTYLIDKNGTIIMKETGAATWDSETVKQTLSALLEE